VPGYDYILNPQRQSNPFTPTTKPVWLKKPADPGSREQRRMPTASDRGKRAQDGSPPSLLYLNNALHLRRDIDASTPGEDTTRGAYCLVVPSSDEKLSHQSAREKTRSRAPSIPRKPAPLSSKSSAPSKPRAVHDMPLQKGQPVQSPISPASAHEFSNGNLGIVTDPPQRQQPAIQRGVLTAPVAPSAQAIDVKEPWESYVNDAPALPLRRQGSIGPTTNLMDENDTQEGRMYSWKPLRPQ